MAVIYSKVDGRAVEVDDYIFAELTDFEASSRGYVLGNFSAKPIDQNKTHVGMMRVGEFVSRSAAEEALKTSAAKADADRRKLEVPAQDAAKGADWSGLVE